MLMTRDSQVPSESIAHRWTAAWSTPPDEAAWLSLYHPTAVYIDHAFQIRRAGTSMLARHFHIWRTSMPDFVTEVTHLTTESPTSSTQPVLPEGKYRCSFRTLNSGTFLHDLPSRKATGKKFSFQAVVDLIVREEDGLIEEVNEYYTSTFDKDVSNFHSLEDFGP